MNCGHAPPAVLSAFAGAMSSREDLVHCPLLQGQTGVVCCPSSLAGQTACRRQADTSDTVPVASSNLEHPWDHHAKNKVSHPVFCTCTQDVNLISLPCRTDPIAKAAKLPAPVWSVKPQPKHQLLQKALLIDAVLLKQGCFFFFLWKCSDQ